MDAAIQGHYYYAVCYTVVTHRVNRNIHFHTSVFFPYIINYNILFLKSIHKHLKLMYAAFFKYFFRNLCHCGEVLLKPGSLNSVAPVQRYLVTARGTPILTNHFLLN